MLSESRHGLIVQTDVRALGITPHVTPNRHRYGRRGTVDGRTIRFQRKLLPIANALVDQSIGLKETDDGFWSIYFNTVLIATLDEREYIIRG